MTLFDRACISDSTCCGGIIRVLECTGVSWSALGILLSACSWLTERCGPGSINSECGFEPNKTSRDPRHRNHAACAARATDACPQTFGPCGRGPRDCRTCSRARRGDHREAHTWRGRPG